MTTVLMVMKQRSYSVEQRGRCIGCDALPIHRRRQNAGRYRARRRAINAHAL